MSQNSKQKNLLSLLDQIRAIAAEGLQYSRDKFGIERYEKLMKLAAEKYSDILNLPEGEVLEKLKKELGCITPKLGVDVAVTNKAGEVLILRRVTDNDPTWSLPCGFVDLSETPFETAVRETKEEAGLDIEPAGYIAITNKGPEDYPKIAYQVNFLIAAKPVPNEVQVKLSHEHSDFQWIKENSEVDWHAGHERLAAPIFDYLKTGHCIPHHG